MRYASRRFPLRRPFAFAADDMTQVLRCLLAAFAALVLSSAHAAERAIARDIVVPANVDAVWAAWTTREGIVSFFAPEAEIDARVGGAFHIFIDPLAEPGKRGADDMRFLALQPKRMLSFDWNAPPDLPEVRAQRTFVVVRLHPIDDKSTRVSVHHSGWGDGGEWDRAFAYFDRAWSGVLINLRRRFERGPMDWSAWLAQLRTLHGAAPAAKDAAAPGAVPSASKSGAATSPPAAPSAPPPATSGSISPTPAPAPVAPAAPPAPAPAKS